MICMLVKCLSGKNYANGIRNLQSKYMLGKMKTQQNVVRFINIVLYRNGASYNYQVSTNNSIINYYDNYFPVRYKDPCKPYDGFPNKGTAPKRYVLPNVDHPLQRDPWYCCAKQCGTKPFKERCGGPGCHYGGGCCPALFLETIKLDQSWSCKEKKSSPCLYPPLIGLFTNQISVTVILQSYKYH